MRKFILCLVGFPASGKSTFAKKLQEKLKFNLFHLGKNITETILGQFFSPYLSHRIIKD